MKRFLVAIMMIVTIAAVTAAQSVDWKGFYVGGSLGGALGRANATTTTIFSPTGYFAQSSPPVVAEVGAQNPWGSGLSGGVRAGYNAMKGMWVYGAEIDFGAMVMDGSQTGTAPYPVAPSTTLTITQSVKTSLLLTVRPRIGVVLGKSLYYLTGGLAITNLNYQEVFTDTFADCNENGGVKTIKFGWTAGGGIEYRPGGRWSVKAEYLYAGFGTVSTTSTNLTGFSPPIPFPSNEFTHSASLRAHVIRGGVNYRF
jgi:outer membrane immunogenic protein